MWSLKKFLLWQNSVVQDTAKSQENPSVRTDIKRADLLLRQSAVLQARADDPVKVEPQTELV